MRATVERDTPETPPPWQADKPYNQLPSLPPAVELETRAVLKRCIEARVALAELKQAAELIPNQTVLINTIPLLEAKDSSEIESIVTTTDLLFQHARHGENNADPATSAPVKSSTPRRKERSTCAICWSIGSPSCITRPTSIHSFEWR
jgi:hypothetical protein